MANFYVYTYLRNKKSKHGEVGMPYYVGKGSGNKAYSKQHCVPVPKDRANIVIVASNLTEQQAFDEEIRLIAFYGRIDNGTGCLQNRKDGGDGGSGHHYGFNETSFKPGHQHTAETRAKIGQAHKGKKHTAETRARQCIAARLRCTPEVRARMSAAQKARFQRAKQLQQELQQCGLSAVNSAP